MKNALLLDIFIKANDKQISQGANLFASNTGRRVKSASQKKERENKKKRGREFPAQHASVERNTGNQMEHVEHNNGTTQAPPLS